MKVVLVNTPLFVDGKESDDNEYLPPLGLGYIATDLIDNNISTDIVDSYKDGDSVENLLERLEVIQPEYIGLNIFSVNIEVVKRIIKEYNKFSTFIIGGQCVAHIIQEILTWNTPNEIIVVIGEGDFIVKDIVLNKVKQECMMKIKNIIIYKIDKHSPYYPIDINATKINYNLFPNLIVSNHYKLREGSIITSRGCIYNCAFCGAAKSLNMDYTVRTMVKQHIMYEIESVLDNRNVECIRVLDDLFIRNFNSVRTAIEIFNRYNVKWRAMAHVKSFIGITNFDIEELKKSGCLELFIGIESGSERIRRFIKKLGSSNEVAFVISKLLQNGINVKGYFIYGFPTEKEKDMDDTYKLAKKLHEISSKAVGKFRASVFQYRPYHGTKLYKYIKEARDVELQFKENSVITSQIGRGHFNMHAINCSDCSDSILNHYIKETSKIN